MNFLQTPPQLPDAWSGDRILREAIGWMLGDELFRMSEPDLGAVGEMATAPETLALAARAETEPPVHVPYATWGDRIDDIRVSGAWLELGRLGIEAGVTAMPYEASQYEDKARIVWAATLCMWGASSALYSCPVAMTDGAARTLLQYGDAADLEIVSALTTRDYGRAWTSGQWMTETVGGSDVSRTETVARRDPSGDWRLYGTKWFTSATTSEMALTLARPEGAPSGSRGLALFRVLRKLDDGSPNAIVVRRLKDKLGTRALPTAELELKGALASPVGDPQPGSGIRRIATMLNITRIHNSLGAAGALGRGLAWARAYARVREVFDKPLESMPAHQATLVDLAVDYAAAMALVLRCCELTGRAEHSRAAEEDLALLRALTPVTKLATGRWSIAGVTEAMEAIGGVGYCEDSTIPALVRNTHVIPIWEGTTNVLSLDVLRAAQRAGAIEELLNDALEHVEPLVDHPGAGAPARTVVNAVEKIRSGVAQHADDSRRAEAGARSTALSLGTTYACARLCAQGAWATERGSMLTLAAAQRLAARGLVQPPAADHLGLAMDEEEADTPSSYEALR